MTVRPGTPKGMIANVLSAIDRHPGWTIITALLAVSWVTGDQSRLEPRTPTVDAPRADHLAKIGRALYLGATRLLPDEQRHDADQALASVGRVYRQATRLFDDERGPRRVKRLKVRIVAKMLAPPSRPAVPGPAPVAPCG